MYCITRRADRSLEEFSRQLWFDDLAGLQAAMASLEWRASSDDEANFTDPAPTALFLTEEREIPNRAA